MSFAARKDTRSSSSHYERHITEIKYNNKSSITKKYTLQKNLEYQVHQRNGSLTNLVRRISTQSLHPTGHEIFSLRGKMSLRIKQNVARDTRISNYVKACPPDSAILRNGRNFYFLQEKCRSENEQTIKLQIRQVL